LFNGVYGVIIGIFHMFISVNMGRFSRTVHFGDLDGILVKPLDSQFSVSLWLIDFTIIFRILIAAGFAFWIFGELGITLTLAQIAALMFFALCAWVVLYAIWFLVLTNVIWHTTLSNLVFLLYSFESVGRFPKEMLAQLSNIFFLIVLPVALVVNTPTRVVLGKLVVSDAVTLLVLAVGLGIASRAYWRYALRHYTSASS
jgi:ABC-2 type transport system permease protein